MTSATESPESGLPGFAPGAPRDSASPVSLSVDVEPAVIGVSEWAAMGGSMIPVAAWDRQNPDVWRERIRATVAFAMGMLTELEEHGADLGAGQRVDLDDAAVPATAGIPAGVTFGAAGSGRQS